MAEMICFSSGFPPRCRRSSESPNIGFVRTSEAFFSDDAELGLPVSQPAIAAAWFGRQAARVVRQFGDNNSS